jgi:branched-chain amino acid transport system ATP-binding protein
LSVRENVTLAVLAGSRLRFSLVRPIRWARAEQERVAVLLDRWGMREVADTPTRELAYGEQRRVEIVLALAQEPKVLLLDEPTAGLSQSETDAVVEMIAALPRDITVVFIEHDMQVAFALADTLSVLNFGCLLAEGTPEEIRANARVRDVYLREDA